MSNLKILENVILVPYTTLKIGGPAKYFFEAKSKNDIIDAIRWAKEKSVNYFILGGGSNILISDAGFNGLVIKIQDSRFKIQDSKIVVGAGLDLARLVQIATENSLTGLEWAAGIPGTVGGAIRGNAGAMGQSMSEIIKQVDVLVDNEKIEQWDNKQCQFGYRDSVFKQNPNLIILSAEIQLEKGDKQEIQKKIEKYLEKRKSQPIEPSAGCVFKNIEVDKLSDYPKLCQKYPEIKGAVKNEKLSAGWLIEQCDLKGKQIGQAKISEKHANFIVNLGGAKAEDVLILISLIKQRVRNKFGIQLQEEIEIAQ
ncbi:MAG: UDP-N-acetylmuramate dehydrogenase [Patescibacteria group bacterium]